MGQIGKELREITVEPLENPVPKELPEPSPAPQREVEAPEPERVPAGVGR